MSLLLPILQHHIRTHGPLTVEGYMHLCLYHPQHGYYTTGRNFLPIPSTLQSFNPSTPPYPHDFTTAPELTPLFGITLAEWVAKQWHAMGQPTPFHLVECGPGRGSLMLTILKQLQAAHPHTYAAANPFLVETSPALQTLQRQTLAAFPQCGFGPSLPAAEHPTILIGNELLDAFPIQQLMPNGTQRGVTLTSSNQLAFTPAEEPTSESSPTQTAWLENLKTHYANIPTAVLLCDYGAAPAPGQLTPPTLQAIHAHTKVSPLHLPGETDLTAHVNFTHVIQTLGPESCTLTDLTPFLLAHNIASLGLASPQMQHPSAQSALQRLLHPAQMGTLFKVLCCTWPAR